VPCAYFERLQNRLPSAPPPGGSRDHEVDLVQVHDESQQVQVQRAEDQVSTGHAGAVAEAVADPGASGTENAEGR